MKKHYFITTKNTYYLDGHGNFKDCTQGILYRNAFIKYLYSYDTLIGYVVYSVNEINVYLTRYYRYSRTTIQHLHKFLNFCDIKCNFNIPIFRKQIENGGVSSMWHFRGRNCDIFYHYDRTCYDMETIYNLLEVNN